MKTSLTALLAAVVLAGCGLETTRETDRAAESPVASTTSSTVQPQTVERRADPSAADLSRALSGGIRLGDYEVPMPILESTLGECRGGQMPLAYASGVVTVPVQVCSICVVHLDRRNETSRGPNPRLLSVRRRGDAVFASAISDAHPEIQPADGEPGVWVARDITYERTAASARVLSDQFLERVGWQMRPSTYFITDRRVYSQLNENLTRAVRNDPSFLADVLAESDRCDGAS